MLQVSSPGGEMSVNTKCGDLIREIGTHKFPTHLVILPSQGLDVILGMNWLTVYGGVIDCVNRSITLTTQRVKGLDTKPVWNLKILG